jgi:hypothetical protein
MRQGIVLLFGLFVILGCGYQSSPSEKDASISFVPNTPNNILPEKISVNFPTVLKDTITAPSKGEDSEFEEKKENNLKQLQKDIYKAEDMVQIAEFNMILLEQVMPKILQKCEGIEHCQFEERELSFLLDEELIFTIDSVLNEKNRNFLDINNTMVYLGDIEFFKYENQKYEYELNFNMLNSSFIQEDSAIGERRQIFKWSSDNPNVVITYLYAKDVDRIVSTVRYFVNNEGNEFMYLSDKNDTNISIENTTLVVKNDENNSSYSLTSNTTIQQLSANETNSSHFSTNIEMDDRGTQLLLLDKNTTLSTLDSVDKDENLEIIPTKPIVVTVPSSNLETGSSFSEENKLTLFVFEVDGDGLASGDYILLKPDTDTLELDLEALLEMAIGSFSVIEGTPQGSLYSNEFLDILDELVMVKIIDSQESTELSEFIVIENKPKLNIVKK